MTYLFSNCSFGEHEEHEFLKRAKLDKRDECIFLNSCRPLFSRRTMFDGIPKDCWLRANYRNGKRVDYFNSTNLDVVMKEKKLFRKVYGLDCERGDGLFFVSELLDNGKFKKLYDLELDSFLPDYSRGKVPTTGLAVYWILRTLEKKDVTLVNFRNTNEPNYNLAPCHDWMLEDSMLNSKNGVMRIDLARKS